MTKIKILFILASMNGGGAERVVLNTIRHIDRSRFEPALALLRNKGDYLEMLPPDVSVYDLKTARSRYAILPIARVIRRNRPDVVVSAAAYINATIYMATKISGHDLHLVMWSHTFESKNMRQASPLIRLLSRWFYAKAEIVIALTGEISKDLQENFNLPSNKIRVIPNPIDLKGVQSQSKESVEDPWFQEEVRRDFPLIIAVGSLVRAKGFPCLLHAFAKVRESLKVRLVILGRGKELQELKALSEDLNIAQEIAFLGFESNPYKYMAKADLFVLSSLWEGFPSVLLEAMACGIPIVSTACSSGPDEILTPGVNGLLVSPADCEALAEAISKVIRDEQMRQRFSAAAQEKVVEFDLGNIIGYYEDLFDEIAT